MRKKQSDQIRQQVKGTYHAIADEFDQTRKRQWLEFQYFLEFIENSVKVLDLGCGNGRLYELLKDKKADYWGVDNNLSLIEKARLHFPDAHFELGDMVDLNFSDHSFDAVFCIAAFHHIPGRQLRKKALKEIHRVLKKDGVLIMTVWNLFQWKYIKSWVGALFSFVFHLGFRYAWNDLWIAWGNHPSRRYYHAFRPKEFFYYFKNPDWKIEDFYFVRKGSRVKFGRSFNLCVIARKK
ncbi:methyltransferase domain-containing protein [Candidatus Peregrinibacteria bacterium]|nr:methyltransferase domain-containing protein [Candidatus Peregrinibacteria bacterium]